jgi:hypothetical protein
MCFLLVLLLPALDASRRCEPWCESPCTELNGDVKFECGGCSSSHTCTPGAPGFPASSGMEPPQEQPSSPVPPREAMSRDLRIDQQPLAQSRCPSASLILYPINGRPARLPELVAAQFPLAHCIGFAAAEAGMQVDVPTFVSLVRLLDAREFGVRLGVGELLVAWLGTCDRQPVGAATRGCSIGVAEALANLAASLDSDEASAQLIGLVVAFRVVQQGARRGEQEALSLLMSRLHHGQPGTRWLAMRALPIFAEKCYSPALEPLLMAMQGGVSDPGLSFAAMEALVAVFGADYCAEQAYVSPHLTASHRISPRLTASHRIAPHRNASHRRALTLDPAFRSSPCA